MKRQDSRSTNSGARRPRVTIFQYRMLHYRVQLFNRMRELCAQRGIDLEVVYGQATAYERSKKDEATLGWAIQVSNWYVRVGNRDLIWQPLPKGSRSSDLLVVMQENRLISNYWLLLRRIWSKSKLGFWGHGVNFQSSSPKGIRERWKRLFLRSADWWFPYTDISAQIVRDAGYPAERISVLNNAIDNEGFKDDLESVDVERDLHSAIFCGSLYPDKRLEFLVSAGDIIARAVPNFRLYVLGDGPDRVLMDRAASTRQWLVCLGAAHGQKKAAAFKRAQVVLNPGLVGLHVLDAFCAGLPMITTAEARHSPEIAYLRDGHNGFLVRGGVKAYANSVVSLLLDRQKLLALQGNAAESARLYSLENMAERFVSGIARCVNSDAALTTGAI